MPRRVAHLQTKKLDNRVSRREVEKDVCYKQIIPYQLFQWNKRFFVYQRGSKVGENRLSGRFSAGIGGHINIDDTNDNILTEKDYYYALKRERHEELECQMDLEARFIGWINDDSDSVGQVHLGAVHLCQVEDFRTIKIKSGGENIFEIGWWAEEDINDRSDKFEKWSLLAFQLINKS